MTLTLRQMVPEPRRPVQSGIWLPLPSSHCSPHCSPQSSPPSLYTLSLHLPRCWSQGLCTCRHLFPDCSSPVSTHAPTLPSGPCLNSSPEKPPLSLLTSPQCSLSPFPALVFPIAFVIIRHSLWFIYLLSLPSLPHERESGELCPLLTTPRALGLMVVSP